MKVIELSLLGFCGCVMFIFMFIGFSFSLGYMFADFLVRNL